MSELKVNTIQPAAGNQVTVQAQVLGVPGTDPNHFATVSQLGGGGAGGISRAEAQDLVDSGVAAANRHSDNKDELQTTQTNLDIAAAKQEAISTANAYTDSRIPPTPPTPSNFGLGQVVPLLATNWESRGGYYPRSSAPLPEGLWWVNLTGVENYNSTDEDASWQSSSVWSVPSGFYLTFAPNGTIPPADGPSAGESGVSYSLTSGTGTDISSLTAGSLTDRVNWQFVKGVTNGMQTVWDGTSTDNGQRCVFSRRGGGSKVSFLHGFAMKVG